MRHIVKNEKGQLFVLAALILPIFFILAGLAIDLGWYVIKSSKIQDSADLAALSGAQHLPENSLTSILSSEAYNTALDVFEKNYGNSNAVSSISLFKGNFGIKVKFEDEIPLFFMSFFGYDVASIVGKSEAIVEAISKPPEAIPIALFTSDLRPFLPLYGQTVTIYGDSNEDINKMSGNFGLIDLSTVGMGNEELSNWILNDYVNPPSSGERTPVESGVRTGPVFKGFTDRINAGKTSLIAPVIDIDTLVKDSSSETAIIVGYAKFNSITVSKVGNGVTVTGKFMEFIDNKAEADGSAKYFGGRTIFLVK